MVFIEVSGRRDMTDNKPLTPQEIEWFRRFMDKPYTTLASPDLDVITAQRVVMKVFATRLFDKAKNDKTFQDDPKMRDLMKDLAQFVTEAQEEKKKDAEKDNLLKGKMKKYVTIAAASISAVVLGGVIGATAYLTYRTKTVDLVALKNENNSVRAENEEFKKKADGEISKLTQTIAAYQTEISTLSGKMGGLEKELVKTAGKTEVNDALARKMDTTAFNLKVAELNKQLTDLKSAGETQAAKYSAGEEAYTKLAARAEETRDMFEKFVRKYDAFETTAATKEYADGGAAVLRKYVDDELKPRIAEGKTSVEQLRKAYGENNEEVKRWAGLYTAMDGLCKDLDTRLKKVENVKKNEPVPNNKQ